jgi:hypothetical protein
MNKFWVLILFASFVALCSFDKADVKKISDKLSAEEKTWMDPFFRGVMLQNQGIYTLCGSKPMTMVRLEPESGSNPAAANKKKIALENYHLLENWKNWEKVKSKFPLHRFAFFKKLDADDPSLDAIYFADLTKVALVLQENYNIFRKETGLDFDVLDESLVLEQGSEFWEKVFDHPALLGLLLGYGMKNSFCFQWKYGSSELQEKITNALSFRFSDKPHGGKATFNKLSLPIFASFSDGEDEMIEKYRKEREAIRTTYEEKDFLLLTLQKLTQVDE